MIENQLSDEVRLAGKAGEVLKSEAFKAAFNMVEEALLNGMKSSSISDEKLRLRLLDKFESLHALRDCLQGMVDSGLMAEEQLRHKSVAQKIKDFVHG